MNVTPESILERHILEPVLQHLLIEMLTQTNTHILYIKNVKP